VRDHGPGLVERFWRNRWVRALAVGAVALGVLWFGLWMVFLLLVARTGLFHG
jgi:hypothetical protein